MSTKDQTHEAIAQALSDGTPLTHDQRALLLGLVIDDKMWQREYDKAAAAVAAERERRTSLAADFAEYLYRTAAQVPFEHAAWASERGAALLEALKA